MSGKRSKLLRKGAEKFNLPITRVKNAFKNASPDKKKRFLERARGMLREL